MAKKKSCMKYIFPLLIVIFAAFLRLFRLDAIPLGMHIDEAGLGLNAWSIAQFATDRYGNFLPVCPSNFYGEQSAFYTYFCAALVKLFGLSIYTLRLPAAILGIISVIFGALILKERWENRGFYCGLILFSVFPYFVINSRFALDCNAMLATFSIALYALIRLTKAVENHSEKKFYFGFILVGVLFGIVLYTYIIAAIATALFCIVYGIWFIFYKKEQRGRRFVQLVFMALPLMVMAVPLVLVFLVNYLDLEPIYTGFFSVPKMLVNRTEEVSVSGLSVIGKLKRFIHVFTSDGKYGSSDKYWTFYPISVPFIFGGGVVSISHLVKDIRNRRLGIDAIILIATFAEIVLFVLCGQYNYHINGIFVLLGYFCINGILSLKDWMKRFHSVWPARVYSVALTVIYLVLFIGFSQSYFLVDTTNAYMVYGGVSEAVAVIPSEKKTSDIYVLDEVGEIYFLSHPESPDEFSPWYDENGLIRDYNNLHFHDPSDYQAGDVIICNRANPRFTYFFEDGTDETEYFLEYTEHYCVFYKK